LRHAAHAGLRLVGALGWRPAALSREVATAVSAQVAIVLTRSIAIEAEARMAAAREGERLRTALIDSLTHELRTPLTSIRAAATTCCKPRDWTMPGGWTWQPSSTKRPQGSMC